MRKTCSDCIHCKIRISTRTLACSKGHWRRFDYDDKVFLLNKGEVGRHEINLRHRTIFNSASKCPDYEEV